MPSTTSRRRSWILIPILSALSIPLAMGHQDESPAERAIKYRSSVMKILRWNLLPMGAMLEGKRPFDQTLFAKHARDLAATANLDLLGGFPRGSDKGGDTDVKAEIWLNWEDFKRKLENFRAQAAKLAEVAAKGDRSALVKPFEAVGESCKSCHKAYRE